MADLLFILEPLPPAAEFGLRNSHTFARNDFAKKGDLTRARDLCLLAARINVREF